MQRKEELIQGLEEVLVSRGLPKDPVQIIGRKFCIIYIAPLSNEENDERFYKYYSTQCFEEYMGQEDRNEEDNSEEYLLLEVAIYGTISGISYEEVEEGCCLHFDPIETLQGMIDCISLNVDCSRHELRNNQMPRVYPSIDAEHHSKDRHAPHGLPAVITLF